MSLPDIPGEFYLFALTLLGVAIWHTRTLSIALTGLAAISLYQAAVGGYQTGAGLAGWLTHLQHEWSLLANLFLLLTGFAILARHFEESRAPLAIARHLPAGWHGAFLLLVIVFALSAFLDNIAGALIGGTLAKRFFGERVQVGYLAAIVAAANAGGAGSAIGDTTTTMMWISGISPLTVLTATLGSAVALCFFGLFAARAQQAQSPISTSPPTRVRVDSRRLAVVGVMLASLLVANILVNSQWPHQAEQYPFLGMAIWTAILLTRPLCHHDWTVLPQAAKGAIFLLALVLAASLMPVASLPPPSWPTALGLGFVSAAFDNIPLTALAIRQDGYDWGLLAYAVGFGGSMLWFGSSAGVALANEFPQAKSTVRWLREGWHVIMAYPLGFFAMLLLLGWEATPINALAGR